MEKLGSERWEEDAQDALREADKDTALVCAVLALTNAIKETSPLLYQLEDEDDEEEDGDEEEED